MNLPVVIHGREKDLGGGFIVRRLLPAAQRQSVGPFVFFDHFGPVTRPADADSDVRPHPHIGLATVTYLFEGAMDHRDSLGTFQRIEPGAINWMSAGRGIVHSERSPADLRGVAHRSHGLQLWAALPREFEESEPSFGHTPANAIPETVIGGARVRVLIGEAWGLRSPAVTLMQTLYLHIDAGVGAQITLPNDVAERAIYCVDEAVTLDGVAVAPHTIVVLSPEQPGALFAERGAQVMLIGGAPLDAPRFIWWNFVSSSRDRIEQAKQDWQAQRMGLIPGETEFIPLPSR